MISKFLYFSLLCYFEFLVNVGLVPIFIFIELLSVFLLGCVGISGEAGARIKDKTVLASEVPGILSCFLGNL